MHKSKLAGFIIDCQTDDLKKAADFWGPAFVWSVKVHPGLTNLPRSGTKSPLSTPGKENGRRYAHCRAHFVRPFVR